MVGVGFSKVAQCHYFKPTNALLNLFRPFIPIPCVLAFIYYSLPFEYVFRARVDMKDHPSVVNVSFLLCRISLDPKLASHLGDSYASR